MYATHDSSNPLAHKEHLLSVTKDWSLPGWFDGMESAQRQKSSQAILDYWTLLAQQTPNAVLKAFKHEKMQDVWLSQGYEKLNQHWKKEYQGRHRGMLFEYALEHKDKNMLGHLLRHMEYQRHERVNILSYLYKKDWVEGLDLLVHHEQKKGSDSWHKTVEPHQLGSFFFSSIYLYKSII